METFAPLTADQQPEPELSEVGPLSTDGWGFKFSDGPNLAGNAITFTAMNVSYITAPAWSVTDSIKVTGTADDGQTVQPWTETVPVVDEVVGRQTYDRVVYL